MATYNTSVIYAYLISHLNLVTSISNLKLSSRALLVTTFLTLTLLDLGTRLIWVVALTVSTPFLFGSKLSLYGGLDQTTYATLLLALH